ncbi:MAG: hypothetical protein HZB80_01740 [Deltaproteobacteria bacterium]|nr:hypothetical protein [Deltaproteobacteria bacterium]
MKIIKPKRGNNEKQVFHFPICGSGEKGSPCLKAREYIPLEGGVYIKPCGCGSGGILLTLKATEHMKKAVAAYGKGA